MTKRVFGQLELTILNIVRAHKRVTVKEVNSLLGEKDKYTTIMTVMNRLVKKNEIAREYMGSCYEYWALPAAQKTSSLIEKLKQAFGSKTSAMLSYLLETADDLTDEDLIDIKNAIEAAKEKRKSS